MTRELRATTVIGVVKDGQIAMASDGQVTVGDTIMKHGAQKVREAAEGRAVFGFAGGVADALALTERLEAKLEAYPGKPQKPKIDAEHEIYKYNGEYWQDELGYYRYKVTSICKE